MAKSVNKVKSKYKYAKSQYQNFEQELKNSKLQSPKFKTPDYMKTNPFYWGNLIKTKLLESLRFFFENFKNKPKLITQEESKNIPIHIKNSVNKLTRYSKNAALSIIDTTNKLILKITFGYLDIRKLSSHALTPVFKNFYLTTSKLFNYQSLMILYKKMGNAMNKFNQETMKNLSKYRDPKIYGQFKKNYDGYFRQMSDKIKNKNNQTNNNSNFLNGKLKNFYDRVTSLGYNRSTIDKKVNKINDYINSPWYKQKLLKYQMKFRNIWKEKNQPGGIMNYSFYREKVSSNNLTRVWEKISYSNAQNFMRGGLKRQFRKFLFYIFSFFAIYYSIKYFLHRLFNRKSDKNLEEALNAVRDLKLQNEELMKYNRDLIDKIIGEKKLT